MHSALCGCSCCVDRGTHTPASSPRCLTIGDQVLLTYKHPDIAANSRPRRGGRRGTQATAAVEMRIRRAGAMPVHLTRERNIGESSGLQERNPPGNHEKGGA